MLYQPPVLTPEQKIHNDEVVSSFLSKRKFDIVGQTKVYKNLKLIYHNLTKKTNKTYYNVVIHYKYNEINELCIFIPMLCGRRYRFSQFDLRSCYFNLKKNKLIIEGKDWAHTGKGNYKIEISRSYNFKDL